MPHSSLKIVGGVIETETPSLNQAGIASCNLIRFKYDPQNLSLPEKLGGWSKFYAGQITEGPIRDMEGYQDINGNKWLVYGTAGTPAELGAVGCTTDPTTGITTGTTLYDITPGYVTDMVPASFQTVAGSNQVSITDPTLVDLTIYDSVYISSYVAVGGIVILPGIYQTLPPGTGIVAMYSINAVDNLQNANNAIFTTTPTAGTGGGPIINVPAMASSTPTTVTFGWASPSYTFTVGTYLTVSATVTSPTAIGPVGPTWQSPPGVFLITDSTATTVTISSTLGAALAGAFVTLTNWGMLPQYTTVGSFSITQLPGTVVTCLLPNNGYQVGSTHYVNNITHVGGMTLLGPYMVTNIIDANNFQFYGTISISGAPKTQSQGDIVVTGGTSTGGSPSHITLNFSETFQYPAAISVTSGSLFAGDITLNWTTPISNLFRQGYTIIVSGITPSNWNGSFIVFSSNLTNVTFHNASASGSYVSGGSITFAPLQLNQSINVTEVNPSSWNGTGFVIGVTASSVTYELASTGGPAAGPWVSGGLISTNGGDIRFAYFKGEAPPFAALDPGTTEIGASNWEITNWGSIALACPVGFTPAGLSLPVQPIFAWDPTQNQSIAIPIPGAPPASTGILVAMPQRQIIAWGTSYYGIIDPLLIRWCDVNNFFVWVGTVSNQAGSYRIPNGAAIIGAMQTVQQTLYWTNIDLWTGQYVGPPDVYGFNKIGSGCGLIARHAMGNLNNVVLWMGQTQFFSLTAEGVIPIPCPIWDVAFQNLDLANVSKITCAVNSLFQEVAWYFPELGGTGEVSQYVKYNLATNMWDYGALDRSAWIDVSPLGQPIGFSPANQYLYQHEISPDADGAALMPSFTTGWFAISEGDQKATIDQWWPDFLYTYFDSNNPSASVQLTFNFVDYPWQTPQTVGPYTVTNTSTYISPRLRGRLASITVSSSDTGTWWRMGNNRFRVQADGKY